MQIFANVHILQQWYVNTSYENNASFPEQLGKKDQVVRDVGALDGVHSYWDPGWRSHDVLGAEGVIHGRPDRFFLHPFLNANKNIL